MATFFKRYLQAILRRPDTLEILAWEAIERNELTRCLEDVRAKTALEFFELMKPDPPDDIDLTALVIIMAGAVNFLAVRSRIHRTLGGVDLQTPEGWMRIEDTIDKMMASALSGKQKAPEGRGVVSGYFFFADPLLVQSCISFIFLRRSRCKDLQTSGVFFLKPCFSR